MPVPFPPAVSGEYGNAPTPSPFNAPLQSQSPQLDPLEHKQRAGSTSSVSSSASGNASSPSLIPQGQFQSELT